jgi:DNA-binding NarL/FixJ family response regulator
VGIAVAQPLLGEALSRLLADVPCVDLVACTGRADESLRAFQSLCPDLVLIGPHLADSPSEALVLAVTSSPVPVRALALVTHPGSGDLAGLLNAGASGHICLTDTLAHMLAAIHTALDRPCLRSRDPRATAPAPALLSDRERELVDLLARGASQKQVAMQMGVTVKTVETFRLRAGRKLGARTTAELVTLALRSDPSGAACSTLPGAVRPAKGEVDAVPSPRPALDHASQQQLP